MLIPVQTLVEQQGPGVLSLRDDKGHTPAHWACLGGHTAILRFLIENKVSWYLCCLYFFIAYIFYIIICSGEGVLNESVILLLKCVAKI